MKLREAKKPVAIALRLAANGRVADLCFFVLALLGVLMAVLGAPGAPLVAKMAQQSAKMAQDAPT